VSTPADEGRHEPGPGEHWQESWYFDFSRADGTGGFVRLGFVPHQRVAWYWAYLVTPDRGLVVVRDHEVPLPRSTEALDAVDFEVRADSLWAEVVCETPMEHWGLGLESFGVCLDEPADAYRGELGERLAVGLDLEWEVISPVFDYPYPADSEHAHYEHAGIVHGELLIGPDRIPFEGYGTRDHSWGDRDWWSSSWHWSSFQLADTFAANVVHVPGTEICGGYVWRIGEPPEPVTHALVETRPGADDIPGAARIVLNHEVEAELEVVAAAPVPLEAPDGRTARFPRALCRFTTADGDTGTGWAEWLQPSNP
jgi:hypothetical protein